MRVRRGAVAGSVLAGGLFAAFAALAPFAAFSAPVEAGPARILNFEPFTLVADSSLAGSSKSAVGKTSTGTVRKAHVTAYGRRFELILEKNTRIVAALPSSTEDGPSLSLYKGVLENVPNSWVRMSAKGQSVRGMIWDGNELFIVENAALVRESITSTGPSTKASAADGTIIFKLSDTQIDPGTAVCATDSKAPAANGSAAYKSLLGELKSSAVISQATGANLRLQISALGDSLLEQQYGSDQQARDEILLRLNNVDGIYSSQLGVEIQVPTLDVSSDATTDGVSGTTDASTLLQELGTLRKVTPDLRSRGLTHLFTGRDLDGNTVGIAYRDTLCNKEFGAGLTEVNGRGSWLESLITAHEIGHNFGAVHDGEAPEHPGDDNCQATPASQFIMSPSVNQGITNFSQCSLGMMIPRMQAATCVTALPPADLSVPADLGTLHQPMTQPFDLELPITNVGGSNAIAAHVELLVPPVVVVDDAFVPGGSCTSGAGVISCDLGDVPGSGIRVVHLTLHSDVVGTNSISARVTSQNDASLANNEGYGTLVIDGEADLAVALQSASSVESGKALSATFTATNTTAIDAATVAVDFTLSAGIAADSAQITGGDCSVQPQSVHCTVATIAAKSSVTGTIRVIGASVGTATLQARVSSSYTDPAAANDSITHTIDVTAPPTSPSRNTGGGGGGGSTSALWILGLAAFLGVRQRQAAAARVAP